MPQPPERSFDAVEVPVDIRPDGQTLRFPQLMDQAAVDELASLGFGVYPAFRLRRRRRVSFDLRLESGPGFAWSGDIVAHTWWVAAPPALPRLYFHRTQQPRHCLLDWHEPREATESGIEAGIEAEREVEPATRHHRFLELHRRESATPVPLAVIAKPAPGGVMPDAPPLPTPGSGDADALSLRICFRRIDGELRPWFDLFHREPFPPGVEPEPILYTTARGHELHLELIDGVFVDAGGGSPHIRWYDAYGPVGQPEHVQGVEIRDGHRLVMSWNTPRSVAATSFDLLCRHRGEDVWLDPTIYHKGIG